MRKIVHGENQVASRQALVEEMTKAQQENSETLVFAGKKTNLSELRSALSSGSLLGKNRLAVVENLLTCPNSPEKAKILEFLKNAEFDNDLILWEEKEIKNVPALPHFQAEIFKLSRLIFLFLESLGTKTQDQVLELLKRVKEQEDPEMIFYMLVRQTRLLILARENQLAGTPEWQKRKLNQQAARFTTPRLKQLYRELLAIDFGQKTSSDPYKLSSRLDLWVGSL